MAADGRQNGQAMGALYLLIKHPTNSNIPWSYAFHQHITPSNNSQHCCVFECSLYLRPLAPLKHTAPKLQLASNIWWNVERLYRAPLTQWLRPTSVDTITSCFFNPVETSILASTATDRSIVLYDMRTSSPLTKTTLAHASNAIAWNPMYRSSRDCIELC